MCLYTKSKNPSVAEKDMYVFKVLKVTRERVARRIVRLKYVAPYRGTPWSLDVLTTAEFSVTYYPNSPYQIRQGLHAFTDFDEANGICLWHSLYLFIAKIPKGANYYKGTDGDIVADQMIILSRTHPESLKRLAISHYKRVI